MSQTATRERHAAARAIKARFEARGECLAEWSRDHGFEPQIVYDVLSGRAVGRRGMAHQVAVALGLKEVPLQ